MGGGCLLARARISHHISRGQSFLSREVAKLTRKAEWSKKIAGIGKVKIRFNSTDDLTFRQVFAQREYDISHLRQYERILGMYQELLAAEHLPIIIDAGANVGAASIWFAAQFPRARVLALEPDPGNAAMCRINTERFNNIKVVEGAIGSVSGLVSLANPLNEAWAVQTIRAEGGHILVRTIPGLVYDEGKSAKLFIVKIDIEGFEKDLFEANTDWVQETAAIFVEPHDWLFPGQGTSLNLQQTLLGQRFEIMVSGENLLFVPLPKPLC
jgi:FkbM family methyltransferase